MVQSNELRIGNLVYFTGNGNNNPCPILELWKKECLVEYVGNHMGLFYESNDIQPIPLSAEILEKAGFKLDGRSMFYENPDCPFQVFDDLEQISIGQNVLNARIKYLHQLQNLYFALTGEELPVELY